MFFLLLFFLLCSDNADTRHFNGGTITWQPVFPYINSSIVPITITQSYSWTFPVITCDINVPITTPGRSTQNTNLTCMSDCSTDGDYSLNPVDILTDCQTSSSSIGLLTSERTVSINLTADAHFYLAHVGAAWTSINYPPVSGLQWSLVTYIDLRLRPDGLINTPPVASVVSPQYAIVNQTIQITIPVSDVNSGDDVRCRWAVYTPGSRRRRRFNDQEEKGYARRDHISTVYKKLSENREIIQIRERRVACNTLSCNTTCKTKCACTCDACIGTTCTGASCNTKSGCTPIASTVPTSTTAETPGTIRTTSSFVNRQAIDECGGICYPSSVPSGTTLTDCTISFKGLVPDTWYAVALQVEDFMNTTTLTAMSSVPVQFLIYVMDQPSCGLAPIILPLSRCFDAQVGVSISFNISAMSLCDPTISVVDTILVSSGPIGVNDSDTTNLPSNASVSYSTITWTPLASQLGPQQLCFTAYSDELVQSIQYCVTFNVFLPSSAICVTTTTTTTTVTTSTTTSTTTTTTSITTTTKTTTTATTATTKTTTTIKMTTTTTASTSTSATNTAAVVVATATNNPGKSPSWGLIAGVASLALPLGLAVFCCLYRLCWSGTAKRRRHRAQPEEEENIWEYHHLSSSSERSLQTSASNTSENALIEVPRKSYQVYDISSQANSRGSILVAMYSNTNAKRSNLPTHNTEEGSVLEDAWTRPPTDQSIDSEISKIRRTTLVDSLPNNVQNMKIPDRSFHSNDQRNHEENTTVLSSPSFASGSSSILQLKYDAQQNRNVTKTLSC